MGMLLFINLFGFAIILLFLLLLFALMIKAITALNIYIKKNNEYNKRG